jgi:L-alanine-DL-glutamate epimerase-like enolase superfamily enzyme
MNITQIDIMRVAIPFGTGFTGSRGWTRMESLMVRLETDDGLTGWGEAFGHTANPGTFALLTDLVAPWFLGKNAESIDSLMEAADRAFHVIGRTGPAIYALSAIDIALWDLAAQRAGKPLFQLLGGDRPAELRCYASLMPYGDLAAVVDNALRAVDAGFAAIKLHEKTLEAFRAVRAALDPTIPIMLDVNCAWPVPQATEMATAIRDDGFAWLEEPVWPPEDFAGLAAVRAAGLAIAAGENVGPLHDFVRLLQSGAVDVLQPSVIKLGGITAMRRVLSVAAAYPVRVVPHCFYWGPGYLATAHLIAAMPVRPPLETAFITLESSPHPLFHPARGTVSLPETPGLGFLPHPAVLDGHMVSRHVLR